VARGPRGGEARVAVRRPTAAEFSSSRYRGGHSGPGASGNQLRFIFSYGGQNVNRETVIAERQFMASRSS
jgi:hypothetical protein